MIMTADRSRSPDVEDGPAAFRPPAVLESPAPADAVSLPLAAAAPRSIVGSTPPPGRGARQGRAAALQRLQRTEGNRAVQRLLQRAPAGAPGQGADADLAADVQGAAAGTPLPEPVQRRLETGLGADLSGVRVHTDAEADRLSRSVDAVAFTTGSDIFFRSGAYDPGSTAGLHLLAHEATHTVQQATGQVTGRATGGGVTVSEPDDQLEQAAQRAADELGRQPLAAVAPVQPATASIPSSAAVAVQREPAGPQNKDFKDAESAFLDGKTEIKPGQAQYAEALTQEADLGGESMLEFYKEDLLKVVVADNTGTDQQIKIREWEIQRANQYVAPEEGSKQADVRTWDKKLGMPASIAQHWARGRKFAEESMASIYTDRKTLEGQVNTFNAFVPRANGVLGSMARLDVFTNQLAPGTSGKGVAAALAKGLDDAAEVIKEYNKQYAANMPGAKEKLDVPKFDESIEKLGDEVTIAGQDFSAKYIGLQTNLIALEKEEVKKEGKDDEERLKVINDRKAAIKTIGKSLDTGVAIMSGAPAAITQASDTLAKTKAQIGAASNAAQLQKGQFGNKNPTYVRMNEKGELEVVNLQTQTVKPAEGGEAVALPPASELPSLPKDIEGTLGKLADFYYAAEVRDIQTRLNLITAKCSAMDATQAELAVKQKAEEFANATLAFATKLKHMQEAIANRRKEYREFGIQLDRFAQENAKLKGEGKAPAAHGDRFATLMAAVSQVREVITLAKGAKAQVNAPGVAGTRSQIQANRSKKPPSGDIKTLTMSAAESRTFNSMISQLNHFQEKAGTVETDYAAVESKAAALTKAGPGSSGAY
jgi:hypothetical protein